jgi:hypothetical protein
VCGGKVVQLLIADFGMRIAEWKSLKQQIPSTKSQISSNHQFQKLDEDVSVIMDL